MDSARHDVLVAVACGAGVRKASDHFFTAVALHGNDSIGLVVGFDAENLPALGQPDLTTTAFQEGENAKEGEQFRGQHDAANVRIVAVAMIPVFPESQLGNIQCLLNDLAAGCHVAQDAIGQAAGFTCQRDNPVGRQVVPSRIDFIRAIPFSG